MAETLLEKFERLVKHHDLTYNHSDDGAVWRRGDAEREEINTLAKQLPPGRAAAIWNKWVDKKISPSYRADWYWNDSRGHLELFPAYGKRYKSVEAVMQAWQEGKDFSPQITGGGHLSSRDTERLRQEGYTGVVFRYGEDLQFRSDPVEFQG